VEVAPGFAPIDHFDATDFNQPVAASGAQSGGLGVENNFAHG
jgi:hypothetical protein